MVIVQGNEHGDTSSNPDLSNTPSGFILVSALEIPFFLRREFLTTTLMSYTVLIHFPYKLFVRFFKTVPGAPILICTTISFMLSL